MKYATGCGSQNASWRLDWLLSNKVTVSSPFYTTASVVWCLNLIKLHEHMSETLVKELDRVKSKIFTTRMLDNITRKNIKYPDSIRTQLKIFDELKSESNNMDFTILFEPPSIDERIINQYALFSVMSNPELSLHDWYKEQEENNELLRPVKIDKSLKWEVRNRLDQANMNERILFPGFDGLASWLQRHYGPPPYLSDRSDLE